MCGICGIIHKDHKPVHPKDIANMCKTMIHRGPDDEGIYISGPVGLGMRRLKIIDLESGHQPIHNEDKAIWVVLNGEIYNYKDLRILLEERGHIFYTKSDTEVIVHLYEEYGEKFLDHLNGMYCFAIWDSRSEKVLVARDRLGIKQIYFYEDDNQIIFGSEIKAILLFPEISRTIDYQSLLDYFSLKYIPAPRTVYESIRKLPQASFMRYEMYSGKLEIDKYWSLFFRTPFISGQEAIETTDSELQRAIKYQMISDVPLGAYLSGGIDSSLLVAMMASVSSRPVETFSIVWGSEDQAFDEGEYARFVVSKYKTNHHEFLVRPQVEEIMDKIVHGFDEPFADDSVIPNYYISQETRKFVTVALSGLGGDEMCAGYERHLGMKLLHYYHRIPEVIRSHLISRTIDRIPDSDNGNPWIERIKSFSRISDLPFPLSYFSISSKLDQAEKTSIFKRDALERIGSGYSTEQCFERYSAEHNDLDELNKMLYIDINTYMVDQLLVLSDRMSMAHSIELRVPYLDHLLVEHFARIDPMNKIHGFTKKYLLKRVAEKYFPKSFIYRKKMGFSSPIVLWLRNDLKNYMLHLLNRKSIERTNIINPDTVERYIREHLERRHNHEVKLWSLIMFMLWYDLYIDKVF